MTNEYAMPVTVNLRIVLLGGVALSIVDPAGKRIGGNIRTAKRMDVEWENQTDRPVMLRFEEWEIDRPEPVTPENPVDPVWPFIKFKQSDYPRTVVDANQGVAWIPPADRFGARLAGMGRMIVKYVVYVPLDGGEPDSAIVPLDPMIIVER